MEISVCDVLELLNVEGASETELEAPALRNTPNADIPRDRDARGHERIVESTVDGGDSGDSSNLLGERASACSPAFTEAFSIADVNG